MYIIKAPREQELRSIFNQGDASGILIPGLIGLQLQIFLCGVCIAVAFVSPAFAASGRRVRTFLASMVVLNVIYTACRAMLLTATSSLQARDDAFFYNTETLEELLAMYFYLALATSVQIFYAIRVAKVLQSKLARLSWLAIFATGLCGSLLGWAGHIQLQTATYIGFRDDLDGPKSGLLAMYGGVVHFFASAFVDILISVTLAISLRRSILGFNARTDKVLQKISRVTLATGALTSVVASVAAILNLASYAVFASWTAMTFSYALASLYCLSVFWTLDLRSRLRQEQGRKQVEISLGLPLNLQLPSTADTGCDCSRLERLGMPYLGDPLLVPANVARSPTTIP